LLGPLTNPAGARRQVVGSADPEVAARLARVLHALGVERAFVVHGDRLDELPLDGSGVVYDVGPEGVRQRTVAARDLGLRRAASGQLTGGSAEENGALIEQVLGGASGPRRDVVVLNAAAGLEVSGKARDLAEGVAMAAETIDSGRAADLLARLRARRTAAGTATAATPSGKAAVATPA
jgi:anthranilate phosphoribosyltransferase